MSSFRLRCALQARALLIAAAVAMPAVIAQPAAAQQPPPPSPPTQVVQQGVEIRGNQRIEDGTILAYMGMRPGQQVTAEDLNIAVRRLFETGLFRDVRLVPAEGRLVVVVEENPSINEIVFEGNDALDDDELQQIISLRPRLPFTAAAAEADAAAIVEVYRRTGRFGASVEPKTIERSDNRVDLVFEIGEGEKTGIKSIDFVGNEAFSDRRLRRVVETRESGILAFLLSGDIYDPDRLELDKELLRQFYLSRGYADFTVTSATAELSPDREGFFITFTVDEGQRYRFGSFDVVINRPGLDREAFLALIPGGLSGDTYDASEVEEIANAMTDLAGQQGYAFVRVTPRADKNVGNRTIDVTFELNEGEKIFVERIEIEGNTRTLDRVIRREIELVEGDAFDARKIREARSDIRGLGYFSSVDVQTEPGSADDRAVLRVKVREKSTGSLSFGAGFSSDAGVIGNVAVTERNFLGRGQAVNAQVTATGDTQVYDFSFTEPRFLDRDLSLGARTFYLQDDRSDESSFRQSRAGANLTAGFPLSCDTSFRGRYSFEWNDVNASDDTSPAIAADEGEYISSAVGYRVAYDKRSDPIEPTSGYLLTLDQEFAGVGGDVNYLKSVGTAKAWKAFLDDQVVTSAEVQAGALNSFDDASRVTDRFFLGGRSLRGFAPQGIGPRDLNTDDAIGGNYYGLLRLETSFPLGLPEELGIFGGAFVDAGTVWDLDQTTFRPAGTEKGVEIDDSMSFRVSTGALLFINSPLGPIEMSFGVPLIKEDFDEDEIFRFSIGTRF